MRKNIKKFAGIVLCIGMFTGCAQTPDSSLVKPKGSKAVDAYLYTSYYTFGRRVDRKFRFYNQYIRYEIFEKDV